MDAFEQKLQRLELALGVRGDGKLAAALGMTPAALSDRKRRGAFPVQRLVALAKERPESGVDPVFVVSGKRITGHVRDVLMSHLAAGADLDEAAIEQFVVDLAQEQAARDAKRAPLYRELVDFADRCDDERARLLLAVAKVFAEVASSAVQPRAAKESRGSAGRAARS
ncbi:MAG: hypothetical protein AMXMBFR78_34050 [Rubrivivax sp.]